MNLKGLAQRKKLSLCLDVNCHYVLPLCVYIVPNLLILDQFVLNITGM
jgi:hypothetical protein